LRAARRIAPARIFDRRAIFSAPIASEVLRGRGLGGRARGTAFVQRALFGVGAASLADVPDGAVLVLPAALPSLAPHLARLSALVTEHGGALSHAATLAREYGLPAVVGCAGALAITPGAQVLVDGEAGRVFLL
jgi:pyruvate,water dikinase